MLDELEKVRYERVSITDESRRLADEYIVSGGLPGKSITDATHIALATLAECDVIVSWNFSHIVNLRAMTAVEDVNMMRKLKRIHIFPPSTLLGGQADEQAY